MKCLLEPPETQLEGVARKLTRNFHNFMTKISSEEKLNLTSIKVFFILQITYKLIGFNFN